MSGNILSMDKDGKIYFNGKLVQGKVTYGRVSAISDMPERPQPKDPHESVEALNEW